MTRLVLPFVLLALLASAVVAQADATAAGLRSARYLARGNTGLASADDGATVAYNPANLAATNIAHYTDPSEALGDPKPWKTECANSAELSGDLDFWSLLRAFRNVHNDWGFGLGYASVAPDGRRDWWTAGFGSRLGHSEWNGGISLLHVDGGLLSDRAKNLFNLGLQSSRSLRNGALVQVGAVVEDVTGQLDEGPLFHLGVAATFNNTLVEVDWLDVTDEIDSAVNLGVEHRLGNGWSLYGGLIDGDDLTAGVGYIGGWWNAALGWMESPSGTSLSDELLLTIGRRIRF
jgi:hypothetical protein